jgi:hypothetical protein
LQRENPGYLALKHSGRHIWRGQCLKRTVNICTFIQIFVGHSGPEEEIIEKIYVELHGTFSKVA